MDLKKKKSHIFPCLCPPVLIQPRLQGIFRERLRGDNDKGTYVILEIGKNAPEMGSMCQQ